MEELQKKLEKLKLELEILELEEKIKTLKNNPRIYNKEWVKPYIGTTTINM